MIDRLREKQGIPTNFLLWEQKLSLYLTTFEAVKNALWLDNRGRKMLKTQATAIPKYGNIVTSGVWFTIWKYLQPWSQIEKTPQQKPGTLLSILFLQRLFYPVPCLLHPHPLPSRASLRWKQWTVRRRNCSLINRPAEGTRPRLCFHYLHNTWQPIVFKSPHPQKALENLPPLANSSRTYERALLNEWT